MSEDELHVFVRAFEASGFTGGLNWYRNFTRNWHLTADYPERIDHPALMIYGDTGYSRSAPRRPIGLCLSGWPGTIKGVAKAPAGARNKLLGDSTTLW